MRLDKFVREVGLPIVWRKTGEDDIYVYGVINGKRVRIRKSDLEVEVLG